MASGLPCRGRSTGTAGGSRTTPRCPSPRATSSTARPAEGLRPDPLRYFLLREIPIGQDGNFSHEGFLHRVNSDLANDFGNLVQRTLTMIGNYFGARSPTGPETAEDAKVRTDFEELKAASSISTAPAPQ